MSSPGLGEEGTVSSLEFSVDMTCGKCEAAVVAALQQAGIEQYRVELASQRVTVTSERTAEQVTKCPYWGLKFSIG